MIFTYKIVVFDEVYILFHFNIILKINGMSSTKILFGRWSISEEEYKIILRCFYLKRGVGGKEGGVSRTKMGSSLQVLGQTTLTHLITNFYSGLSLSPSVFGKGSV